MQQSVTGSRRLRPLRAAAVAATTLIVATVALSSDQFGDAVAVDIDQGEGMRLREGFVDGVADPLRSG